MEPPEVGPPDNKSQAGWPFVSPHPEVLGSQEFCISSDDTDLRSVDVETNKEVGTLSWALIFVTVGTVVGLDQDH